jgi:NADH-quinone oxidoreductase subunit G
VKFTIRAEKCPNRRGVEAVVSHFQKNQASFADLLAACDRGEVAVAFVTSGYSGAFPVWGTENAEQLGKAGFLIVHDMLPSAVSDAATIVIPAASFSEKDGTYINHAGLAQTTEAGCVPQRGARTDGQIYLDLLGRRGLVRAIEIRKEIGKAVPALAALASGELGEHGIFVTAGA